MRQVICFFDTGACLNVITAVVLEQSRLNNIRQRDIPEIRGPSDTKLVVLGTLNLHPRMDKSHAQVTFCIADKLVVPTLLETTFTDKLMKSNHLTEKKIVPYHSKPVPIPMVYKTKSKAENNTSDIRQK